MRENDFIYDCETYPNFFSISIKQAGTQHRWRYEISTRLNESQELYRVLTFFAHWKYPMVGYNNLAFDYPIIHMFLERQGNVTVDELYRKSQAIIDDKSGFGHQVWESDRFIPQIDLLKIHHFDNRAKRTSLKMLQFNMRSHDIVDLPIPPGTVLTSEQMDTVLWYNDHDVDETEKFYVHSLPAIEFRQQLTDQYQRDFMNHNDTKIGKDYIGMNLNRAGIWTKQRGVYNQTKRESIPIADVLLPYIQFEHSIFNQVLDWFRAQVVTDKDKKGNLNLKGIFTGLSATIDGFKFDFGAGGIHGSVNNAIVSESATHKLIDIDVASYYPNLAIANNFYPEHLTDAFCGIYRDVYTQRQQFKKGSPENAMLKLALNGVYGDSNSVYGFYYDPKYTLSITINGQLLLCMLAEQMMKIPDLRMIQLNTDGITFLCPNEYTGHAWNIQKWWEGLTNLELEETSYQKMYIRDVNNYMALKQDGKVKRIGCYAYETAAENPATREVAWHKNFSALVIPKAAEAALVRNVNIEAFIRGHTDWHDFMYRTKVPRSSTLELHVPEYWGSSVVGYHIWSLQNISRYYASTNGGILKKVMPPTAKQIKEWEEGIHYCHEDHGDKYVVKRPGRKPPSGKYKPVVTYKRINTRPDRNISVEADCLVTDCSNMDNFNRENIDYDHYIRETRKIVDALFRTSI